MKLAYVQKVFLIVLFLTLLGSQLPLMSVYAEDESDKSVADFLDEDKGATSKRRKLNWTRNLQLPTARRTGRLLVRQRGIT